jgi:hypothetical protein
MLFAIFGFFLKIYENMGQKLGSNSEIRTHDRLVMKALIPCQNRVLVDCNCELDFVVWVGTINLNGVNTSL